MKLLAYITILAVLWVLLLEYPYAQETIKQMSMKTEAGEIVLTTEECAFKKMGLQDQICFALIDIYGLLSPYDARGIP